MIAEPSYENCPQCGRTVPVDRRFVTWCEHCEWNVDPTGKDLDPVPAWRARRETRLADALYRELEHGRIQRPGWDLARVTAYGLSLALLVLPIGAYVYGVYAVLNYRPLWVGILIGAIAVSIGWLLTPRPARLDPDALTVGPDEAPILFRTLDAIASELGTPPVRRVVVETEPDLWFARIGWRREPTLGIGVPLWLSLRPQERVAVLAHELGHGRNGDARHGSVVAAAEGVLAELRRTFAGGELDEYRRDLGYMVGANAQEAQVNAASRFVNATFGALVRWYAALLNRADLRAGQRAEYLADRTAATVAGSEATAHALERLVLAEPAYRALERAVRYERDLDPVTAVRRAMTEVPARELDRRLRVSRLRDARTDATHPPTYLRARLVRVRPVPTAAVVLGLSDAASTDHELIRAARPALQELGNPAPA